MAAAGLVQIEDASFEKEGRTIPYRKAMLTREGLSLNECTPLDLLLATNRAEEWQPAKRGKKKSPKPKPPAAVTLSVDEPAPKKKRPPQQPPRGPETFSPQESALEEKLRAWRMTEAKKLGLPAFFVFSNQTLRAIVQARPATLEELLAVDGIGRATAQKHGTALLALCRSLTGKA